MTTAPDYDVAISFLSADEPTASALHTLLSSGLRVFFYPRSQEELAGTDGLESMRTPFVDGSLISVVLYRERWGKTPWTRVEETAIKDGCLKHGWQRLFFMSLDDTASLPVWLPNTHVRFSYASYGPEQAAGAIKARVQDSGGVIAPLTASRRAVLYQQEARYLEEKQKISSHAGMTTVASKVVELNEEIGRLCAEISASGNARLHVGWNAGRCVVTNGLVSCVVDSAVDL